MLQVAIDSATPVDDAGPSGNMVMNNPEPFGYGAPIRPYGRMYGSLDFDDVSADVNLLPCFAQEKSCNCSLLCVSPFKNKLVYTCCLVLVAWNYFSCAVLYLGILNVPICNDYS